MMNETEQARERLQAAAAAEGLAQAASATASDAGYEEVEFEFPMGEGGVAVNTLASILEDPATFDDGSPMDEDPTMAGYPFAKFPYGLPEGWSTTAYGHQLIYSTAPDLVPVWAVPRAIAELRARVVQLGAQLAEARAAEAVALSHEGAAKPAIAKIVEALRWEANKLAAGAEIYNEQADELTREWLQP